MNPKAEGRLEKLRIKHETGKKGPQQYAEIVALFNPNQIGISRAVAWEEVRSASGTAFQQFRTSSPATLSLELFFDTYEDRGGRSALGRMAALIKPITPFTGAPAATSVKTLTDQMGKLAQVNQELHRPPYCELTWGKFQIFSGVITQLDTTFIMFMPDGMPVRARVNCSFIEHTSRSYAGAYRELHSADVVKTRTVRRNDTLQSLAAEEYNDAAQWRLIAKANGIVNPRALQPGMVLTIPKLQP